MNKYLNSNHKKIPTSLSCDLVVAIVYNVFKSGKWPLLYIPLSYWPSEGRTKWLGEGESFRILLSLFDLSFHNTQFYFLYYFLPFLRLSKMDVVDTTTFNFFFLKLQRTEWQRKSPLGYSSFLFFFSFYDVDFVYQRWPLLIPRTLISL